MADVTAGADIIPVDMAISLIIAVAWSTAMERSVSAENINFHCKCGLIFIISCTELCLCVYFDFWILLIDVIIIIIIIITLTKQIDKMQSYNRDELINVFEKHSVYSFCYQS